MTDPLDPATVFAALGVPTRLRVFQLIADGPASASTLEAHLPVTRQAITRHLKVLGEAGLVERCRDGKAVIYSARPDVLDQAGRWLIGLSLRCAPVPVRVAALGNSDGGAL